MFRLLYLYIPAVVFYLEKKITMETPNLHIINNAIDDMIPFCVYFIIPYMLWFIYVIGACIYMLFKASDTEFLRFALCLTIGMSVSLLICMIYPSGLTLRPNDVPDNFFGMLLNTIYASDTPTNVFPSIHVYNSHLTHRIHLHVNRAFDSYRFKQQLRHSISKLNGTISIAPVLKQTVRFKWLFLYFIITKNTPSRGVWLRCIFLY